MLKSLDPWSTFQLKQKKKKKCSDRMHLPEDRLSSLPDDILVYIFSFLTYKKVVSTSLLSRRWRNLWNYTLRLHFLAPVRKVTETKDAVITDSQRQHFVKRVNRALQKHKSHYLKEFKIVCNLDERHKEDIDNWLIFSLSKTVEHLDLNLLDPSGLHYNYVFPSQFLDFCSGKANLYYGCKNDILQSDLKCLKSLSLKSVDVTSEAINFLLLNCPFLERLEVLGDMKLVKLVISGPTLALKYLTIKSCKKLKVLSIANSNLVSLDISSVEDFTLTNLPMLVELLIKRRFAELTHSISQASSFFSQLEALVLKGLTLEDATQLSKYDLLTKLKRLVIHVVVHGDESLLTLISLINSCPRLEEFVLMLDWFRRPERAEWNMGATQRPAVNNKSLKVFEFVCYCGRVNDTELIMHVLAKQVGLEKIVIDPRNPLLNESEKEARVNALQQFEAFRACIPPHVHLLIR